jgi:hypothetical protein
VASLEQPAEAVMVKEQALVPVAEPERVPEQARELMAVGQSRLAPRSFDSRCHRNP